MAFFLFQSSYQFDFYRLWDRNSVNFYMRWVSIIIIIIIIIDILETGATKYLFCFYLLLLLPRLDFMLLLSFSAWFWYETNIPPTLLQKLASLNLSSSLFWICFHVQYFVFFFRFVFTISISLLMQLSCFLCITEQVI